jgi:hypothetical protein
MIGEILNYKGDISFELVNNLLEQYKEGIDAHEVDLVVKKRLYAILVECLENAHRHGCEGIETLEHSPLELVLVEKPDSFHLLVGNYVCKAGVEILKKKIQQVNVLDAKGISRLYRATISTTRISEKGGAGLGIIEIARNSRQEIKYEEIIETDKISYMRLIIQISKNPNKTK